MNSWTRCSIRKEKPMKKYRWNKEKFAINILKVQAIGLLALSFDAMFLYALFR